MTDLAIALESHPLLDAKAFVSAFTAPLANTPSPDWLKALLLPGVAAPISADDSVRSAVRALLRHGGFKPTGRSKPASEYLVRAVAEGGLSSINAAVDACNAVSLHSGLPISVVDLDRARAPLRIAVAPAGASYVFNPSGQTIDLEGLVCLFDAEGPCANAVKDAQRTKTNDQTTRTLTVIWGARSLGDRSERALAWHREIVEKIGATTRAVTVG